MRKLVSIGGWCGPALILGKLGLRSESYPFDFSRVTMDGIIHFTQNGFDEGFFPPGPPPYRPECVGIWLLYRGQHTAFAHFDLNSDVVRDAFQRKMERWDKLLHGSEPVTFFRTVAARHPQQELGLIHTFNDTVRRINPRLDFRTVVTVHDQGMVDISTSSRSSSSTGSGADSINTIISGGEELPARLLSSQRLVVRPMTMLRPMDQQTMLCLLDYTEDASKTLFDKAQEGYAAVVAAALDEARWPATDEKFEAEFRNISSTIGLLRPVTDTLEPLDNVTTTTTTTGASSGGTAAATNNAPPPTPTGTGDETTEASIAASTKVEEEVVSDASASSSSPPSLALTPLTVAMLCVDRFPWRSHNNIALIDGVASVGGTCTGIGSTQMKEAPHAAHANSDVDTEDGSKDQKDTATTETPNGHTTASTTTIPHDGATEAALGVCAFCGSADFHKAGRPARSDRPFTDEEDELLVIHLYRILTGADKVAAVEQLAHEMNRGAFEVICRIQFLTNSSTKLTEGLYLD